MQIFWMIVYIIAYFYSLFVWMIEGRSFFFLNGNVLLLLLLLYEYEY